MRNSLVSFTKGLGAGAVIGLALCAGGMMMKNDRRRSAKVRVIRKRISHAAHTAGDIMDNVSSMLR